MKYLKYFESNNDPVKIFNIIINLLSTLGINASTGYFNNSHTLFIQPNLCNNENSILTTLINIITDLKTTPTYLTHKDNYNTYKEELKIINDKGEDTLLTKNVYGQGEVLYKNSIYAIIKFIESSTNGEITRNNHDYTEASFIRNIIIKYLKYIRNLTSKDLRGTIKLDFLYKILYEEISNNNLNHKIFNYLKINNNKMYNNIIKYAKGVNMKQSNELDAMGFMDSYSLYRKESPLKHGEVVAKERNKPIEGGVVLIISRPFPDMNRRVYMAVINHVREDNKTTTERIDVVNQFSILKLHADGNIYPEKVMMTDDDRNRLLGMRNTGLYMHYNKNPLWEISSGLRKPQFFNNYQEMIKLLPEQYKNVIFPITQLKQIPNLHL
jgi:hypothetical protein